MSRHSRTLTMWLQADYIARLAMCILVPHQPANLQCVCTQFFVLHNAKNVIRSTTAESSAKVKMVANCTVDGAVKVAKSTAAPSVRMFSARNALSRICRVVPLKQSKKPITGIASIARRRSCGRYELFTGLMQTMLRRWRSKMVAQETTTIHFYNFFSVCFFFFQENSNSV